MDQNAFTKHLAARGYNEAEVLEREANFSNEDHVHEFSVAALVVDGELTVTTADGVTTCRAGDLFELDVGIPHRETYGDSGAKVLVGRRFS